MDYAKGVKLLELVLYMCGELALVFEHFNL